MLPLPSTWAYQDDGHSGIRYVIVANVATNSIHLKISVIDVVYLDRTVNNRVAHIADEPVLVFAIFIMVANEHLMSGYV